MRFPGCVRRHCHIRLRKRNTHPHLPEFPYRDCAHPGNVQAVIGHAFDLFGKDIVIAHGKDIREGDGIDFCGTGHGIVDFAFTARKLQEAGYQGDMFLHGIYDEGDMLRSIAHWKNAMNG